VSRQAKTVTGVVIVAIAALLAMVLMGLMIGLLVLVVGGLAVAVVLQRSEDGVPRRPRPKGRSRGRSDDTTELLRSATSKVEPLTTWTPPDSLKPWTPLADPDAVAQPAAEFAPAPPDAPVEDDFWSTSEPAITDFSDLAEPTTDEPTSWFDEPVGTDDPFGATEVAEPNAWADGSTWDDSGVATDRNPLDDLARLDDVDVIAEFERLDGREPPAASSPTTSMFDVPAPVFEPPINEDVSSAEDIMAASQATELHVVEEDNSELAKLLAKVQARLAAYE
jgi:hypothetical protein